MSRAFLGLGSNAGERGWSFCGRRIIELAQTQGVRIVDASPLYETEPWESEPGTRASTSSAGI